MTDKASAAPSDAMVLAAARIQSPRLFAHGLEPLPKDGENTAQRMRQETAQIRKMLAAAIAAQPAPSAQGANHD